VSIPFEDDDPAGCLPWLALLALDVAAWYLLLNAWRWLT